MDTPQKESPTLLAMIDQLRATEGIYCKKTIGKGSYSIVKLAWWNRQKTHVALKIIDKRSASEYITKFLPRELDVVRKINHCNIIRVFNIVEIHPFACLVQEYAARGDMLKKIKLMTRISEEDARFYFRQLIEALKHLRSLEIVHRDLKCENVLLDAFDNVKLGDFGFARVLQKGEKSSTFCGSRAYVAPEVLRSRPYTGVAVDIWSAGIVLYVMVTGFMPYDEKNPRKMLERQLQHRIAFSNRRPVSEPVKRLIFQMVHPIPEKRKSYEAIIDSEWLRETPYKMKTEGIQESSSITSED